MFSYSFVEISFNFSSLEKIIADVLSTLDIFPTYI